MKINSILDPSKTIPLFQLKEVADFYNNIGVASFIR